MAKLFKISRSVEVEQKDNQVALGIDLGTTNSLVYCVQDGKFELLVDLLASVVAFGKSGEVVVGNEAKMLQNNPDWVVLSSVKSKMGSDFKFDIFGKSVTPEEISAEILKKLKISAENKLGYSVSRAIITVPAYFDDTQRQATKNAAQLAGLDVLRLINEPTAAAYAYGLENNSEGTYAVYDLGGGTFDVSILEMKMGVFKVLASKGDTRLGGDDFDAMVADRLSVSLSEARKIKERLSSENQVSVGGGLFTRDEFDNLCLSLVHKTVFTFQDALKDANLKASDLRGVILVGGSTRMPIIKEAISHEFTDKIFSNLDPDRIVAMGAAIQADNLVNKRQGAGLLLDITPLSLGIEVMGGIVERIIDRNSPIPISKAQKFTTSQDYQSGILIHVLQGERELVSDCRSLGRFILDGIPPMKAGFPQVLVVFSLDADGILSIRAKEEVSGVEMQVELKPTYGINTSDIRQMLEDSSLYGQEDIQKRLLMQTRLEAEINLNALKKAIDADKNLLHVDEESAIYSAVRGLEACLANNASREEITQKLHELEEKSATFIERRINDKIKKLVI